MLYIKSVYDRLRGFCDAVNDDCDYCPIRNECDNFITCGFTFDYTEERFKAAQKVDEAMRGDF